MEVKVIKVYYMIMFNVCETFFLMSNDLLFALLSSLDVELKSAPQGKY